VKRWVSGGLSALGLLLFAVIVVTTGPGRIVEVFRNVDGRRAVVPIALVGIVLLVRGMRWHVILSRMGVPMALRRVIELWAIGFYASAVTPAKAGDAVRALYVRDESDASIGTAFASVFVDRLYDLIFVLVAGAVSVVWFSTRYRSMPSAWIIVASAVGIGGVLFVASRRRLVRALLRPVVGLVVPEKYRRDAADFFHRFYDAMGGFASVPGNIALAGVLTLAGWILIFTLAVAVAWTFRIPVASGFLVGIMPIVTLVELLPISVSGLGTRDATVIYFFSIVALGRAEAVGFSLGYLVLGTWVTALLGFALWIRHPVPLRGQVG